VELEYNKDGGRHLLEQEQVLTSSRPRPWIRFWARCLDMYMFAVIVYFLLPFNPATLERPYETLLTLSIAFCWFIVEGVCFSLFGTTPGKKLLGIRIYNRYGSKLSKNDGFKRSILVWWRGMGIGLGIVSAIANIVGYSRLVKNGRTTWDRDMDNIVVHEEIGWAKGILTVILYLSLVGLSVYGFF